MEEKTLAHLKTFLINTDTDLVEKDEEGNYLYYTKYQNCIIP